MGRPGLAWLNGALERRGYRPVLAELERVKPRAGASYPDEWWYAIAREVAGDRDAIVNDVIGKLKSSKRI